MAEDIVDRLRDSAAPERESKGTWCSRPDCEGEPLGGGLLCTKPACFYGDDPMEDFLIALDAERSEAAYEIQSLSAQLAEARTALRMGKKAIAAFISIGDRLAVQEPVSRDEIRAGRESIDEAAEEILKALSKIEGEDQ